jgi:methyl-accepting chemotaxis protein
MRGLQRRGALMLKFLKFLTNLSIFRRLFLAATLTALIPGVVIFVLGSSYINTLTTINGTVKTSNGAVKLATDLQADILRMNALLTGLENNPSASTVIQINKEVRDLGNDFNQKLNTYEQNYQITTSDNMKSVRDVLNSNGLGGQTPISQHSMIFVVKMQWGKYLSAQNKVQQDLQQHTSNGTLTTDLAQANLLYLPLKGNLDNLVGLTESINELVVQVNASQITPTIIWTVVAFLFSTVVVFFIGYIVNITITTPLRQLALLTRRIARGDTQARAVIGGRDEITLVATSMNNMLDSIVRLMQDVQSQRDVLQSQVEHLISEVSGIGEGDLGRQAQVTDDALGILAYSFNYMIKELSNLVVRVKMVAQEVDRLTTTTLEHMTQLVEIGDHQIVRINSAGAEVEHMENLTRQVSERARVLYNIAVETRQIAEMTRGAVQHTMNGMRYVHENVQETGGKVKSLGENSREINDIVAVITNVAYQTNRLALDASVQAAMAGDNGKGFAAVASDIRRLSEQTKEHANRIASVVRTVNVNIDNVAASMLDTEQKTADGTRMAMQAGRALESIFDAVSRQAGEIESINKMTVQQLNYSSSIVKTMHSLSKTTLESSDSTRSASQNMWGLAQLVGRLRASVEVFKLREDQQQPHLVEARRSGSLQGRGNIPSGPVYQRQAQYNSGSQSFKSSPNNSGSQPFTSGPNNSDSQPLKSGPNYQLPAQQPFSNDERQRSNRLRNA